VRPQEGGDLDDRFDVRDELRDLVPPAEFDEDLEVRRGEVSELRWRDALDDGSHEEQGILGTADGQGRYKKQTGGRGQFGDCWVRVKPLGRGEGYQFIDSIKGGVIPGKFLPSVDKGVQEAARKGILAGYPMVDLAVECYDGSYHSVDSSDIAFQVAGSMAFQKVARQARPVLLEPIVDVQVTTPDEFVGDIMGDITQRRGKVLGMEPRDGRTVIRAHVPEAELYKYAAALRSMTQGRAHHTRAFLAYEPVPDHEARKIIASREEERQLAHA
ncbi:MAG: hypothetical protein KY453_08970, partial [Gemmatimonadetes bacterium]|nr:hypothetical protein [Gemmatimonadota bacterium]